MSKKKKRFKIRRESLERQREWGSSLNRSAAEMADVKLVFQLCMA